MSYEINRATRSWYGETIGILVLDARYPCVPGNVANASTFPFPVRYQRVENASIERLLTQRDPTLAEAFVAAACELEAAGVKAITGACGFMALFQRQVAAAVQIPVFLSSLSQIPFIYAITRCRVGIITADAQALTPEHFSVLGIGADVPTAIGDMKAKKEFREAILEEKGTLDSSVIEQEAVAVAMDLVHGHPDIGAILLECSDLPPYAHAIQARTRLPVFDFVTMIRYVGSSLRHQKYSGFM
ncbi:aspartate/glutamate racemase family protein [Candidimonas nitroreducens]|uniref:Aspartate/glutamate racemase family protein n=1 Tax=Candidimonas nitroreducens TaxID=683354 RepID=A0A225M9Q7_9BURK|nr:aspartate/glutamate racemase family protein [Candidimonas nitroreducens]OWT55719.1 hypothetical protein CEY11_20595 [Candidimonas nitroreducens]